jgi:hypothetical protein
VKDPRPTGGFDPLGQDLKLREVNVTSFSEATPRGRKPGTWQRSGLRGPASDEQRRGSAPLRRSSRRLTTVREGLLFEKFVDEPAEQRVKRLTIELEP